MLTSDLYGKEIITNTGHKLGYVEDIILDMESGSVNSLMLVKLEDLASGKGKGEEFRKNTVNYERVKNISESVIVSTEKIK